MNSTRVRIVLGSPQAGRLTRPARMSAAPTAPMRLACVVRSIRTAVGPIGGLRRSSASG